MNLVIFDTDRAYTAALVRYLTQKNPDLHVEAFFEKNLLSAYCEHTVPDIILAAEEMADEEVRGLQCGTLILLTDGIQPVSISDGKNDIPCRVGRYQSADEILSRLYLLCRTPETERSEDAAVSGARITVFYAPAPDPLQSTLVWRYVRDRKEGGSALYLNLHENAGFAERFRRQYRRDLSDLLYLSMYREGAMENLLRGIVCEDEGVEYIPPMEQSTDAFLADEKEWRSFLKRLRGSSFSEIVVDLGFLFPAVWEIFRAGEQVYLLTRAGETENFRQKHFLRTFEAQCGSEALKKIHEIRPAKDTGSRRYDSAG